MSDEPTKAEARALSAIAATTDEATVRGLLANAERLGSQIVADAAVRRLAEILPAGDSSAVALDFWRSIHALKEVLTRERRKTTRLSRTRQKIARVGVVETLRDLALSSTPSEGFDLLLARKMADLTAEAVVLRHPLKFSEDVQVAASARLVDAGMPLYKEETGHG
jgi:hypothetical protein